MRCAAHVDGIAGAGFVSRFLLGVLLVAALPLTPPALTLAGAAAERPYSCRLFDEAQRKCAFGSCDARELDRLRRECLRDNGRP
jgi:hypothetical protein